MFLTLGSSNDVQQKRNELDEKLLALEGLKRIQVILEPALSDLSVIGDKLWVVSQIWSFVSDISKSSVAKLSKLTSLSTRSTQM